MKHPDPNSKRSIRRKNRGFKSLELSSRKHRRALGRQEEACTIAGKLLKPGQKHDRETVKNGAKKPLLHTAGGSFKYH